MARLAWRFVVSAAAVSGGMALTGCHSAVSTHVAPGPFGFGWETKKLKGVPVTVRVPTHLRLEVIEQRYIDPKTQCLLTDACQRPILGRRVAWTIQERDEVFTVDSVRPASGRLTYAATLEDQYFKTFNTKIEDTTIQKITEVLGKFDPTPPKVPKGSGNALAGVAPAGNVTLVEGTIAAEIFDLRDPSLEDRVHAFLRQYVNDCHDCPPPLSLPACPAPAKPWEAPVLPLHTPAQPPTGQPK